MVEGEATAILENKKKHIYRVLFFNARSIVSKVDLLQSELQARSSKPDIICICETFCNDQHSDSYLKLIGYEIVSRRDGSDTVNGITRGLLIYCKEGLQASELHIRGAETVTECTGITVPWGGRGQGSLKLSIVLVYRPPGQADQANTERLCQALKGVEGTVMSVGDYNLPGVDWDRNWSDRESERVVVDTFADKFWTQLVRGATHINGNTLDLVTTSNPDMVVDVQKLGYLGNGDHMMIEASLVGPGLVAESTELVPDWRKADLVGMREAIGNVNWAEEFGDSNGADCMDTIYRVLDREMKRFVPNKTRRANQKPIWMNKNILRLIRKKKRLWQWYTRDGGKDYASFQAYRNIQQEVKREVRQAKKKLERKLAKNAKKNSKQFYSYLKKKTANRVTVGPLKSGEEVVTDHQEMADILNNFFCSVFTEEDLANIPEPEQLYHGEDPLTNVKFTRNKVKDKLAKLKPSAAPGPDKVWAKVLHSLADVLDEPLSHVYSKLFEEGFVPTIWRTANVCPVFKKGSKGDPGNYRPISLTCILCKVMESIIRDAMIDFLLSNKLICSSQHGFLPGRSTLTNLLEYLETLTRLIDEGHAVDVLYLDFRKAFDVVPKERLLVKMDSMGLRGKVLNWVREWLSGRTQKVVLNGKESGLGDVRSGVVQGSSLGPTLFLIYINDISTAVSNGESAIDLTSTILSMFADDTKWGRCVDTAEGIEKFQEGINKLELWSRTWQMQFNTSKCKVMHLGRGGNPGHVYMMGNTVLENTSAEKDIGVIVQDTLKPSTVLRQLPRLMQFLVRSAELSYTGTATPLSGFT